jgi:hypothetical protein
MARTNRFKPTEKQLADKKTSNRKNKKRDKSQLREMCKSY